MDETENELIFSKEGILKRTRNKSAPTPFDDWSRQDISYEKIDGLKWKIVITAIEPKIADGILKEIKIKYESSDFEPIAPDITDESGSEDVKKVGTIKQVSNRSNVRRLSDGTKVRYTIEGITYETEVDSANSRHSTLNALIKSIPGKTVNVFEKKTINAKYFKNGGWHDIDELRR